MKAYQILTSYEGSTWIYLEAKASRRVIVWGARGMIRGLSTVVDLESREPPRDTNRGPSKIEKSRQALTICWTPWRAQKDKTKCEIEAMASFLFTKSAKAKKTPKMSHRTKFSNQRLTCDQISLSMMRKSPTIQSASKKLIMSTEHLHRVQMGIKVEMVIQNWILRFKISWLREMTETQNSSHKHKLKITEDLKSKVMWIRRRI